MSPDAIVAQIMERNKEIHKKKMRESEARNTKSQCQKIVCHHRTLEALGPSTSRLKSQLRNITRSGLFNKQVKLS